jgi:diacylglycerol kinase (ATP)
MSKKRILFIINPKSGAQRRADMPELIKAYTDKEKYDFEIAYTNAPRHATDLSRQAANKFDIVVAIGGDGSVNEVAKGLIGSKTALGIIPMGSGNGMALHLKIPVDAKKAFDVMNAGCADVIDTVQVNNEFCIGTIGIGFDAHIAHLFAKSAKRGYGTYVKLVLNQFYKYKPFTFSFTVDGKEYSKECFLLTFANSSQFGNNAVIAPFADVQDGIMEVSIMKRFPAWLAPHLIYRLLHNSIHQSGFFEMMSGKDIFVRNQGELQGHIDGEPVTFTSDIHVVIVPKSLNVIVP